MDISESQGKSLRLSNQNFADIRSHWTHAHSQGRPAAFCALQGKQNPPSCIDCMTEWSRRGSDHKKLIFRKRAFY